MGGHHARFAAGSAEFRGVTTVSKASEERPFHELEEALGYRFEDEGLLHQALVHRSYAHENSGQAHNEPLEFLGDAVLGFLVADRIIRRRPEFDEGQMTRLRAKLVNRHALAAEASDLGLGEQLLLGRGEVRTGGRKKPSILADVFEAVVGAIYLDGGVRAAKSFVRRRFGTRIDGTITKSPRTIDAKTELQEYTLGQGMGLPEYRLVEQRGPDHARRFVVEVEVEGEPRGRGQGSAKKRAEQAAAANALRALRDET